MKEFELSRLVGKAHTMRAKQRALDYAKQTQREVFVFDTPKGKMIDIEPPRVAQEWNVATPAGEYFTMKPKG